MKTTLLIMAAGIGSRYGVGVKQLEPVGFADELIMDYSVHDAIKAGIDKIVIIIRKEIESDFQERIGERVGRLCHKKGIELHFAYQSLQDIPIPPVPERKKPWGTGQAVLAAKEFLTESFIVINADDYYGKQAFVQMVEFLEAEHAGNEYCMAGFVLKNTLSENGGVTRGICEVDNNLMLKAVHETKNIEKTENGASANGVELDPETYVSMNMWGLTPQYVELLEDGFREFFRDCEAGKSDILTSEYLLPIYIDRLLQAGKVSVKVLPTEDQWFGVTYHEDKDKVKENFRRLIGEGVYERELYSDI